MLMHVISLVNECLLLLGDISEFTLLYCDQLMRSDHNDKFIVAELNKLQWTCSSVPKVRLHSVIIWLIPIRAY